MVEELREEKRVAHQPLLIAPVISNARLATFVNKPELKVVQMNRTQVHIQDLLREV
jgi:hypothetical protein